jgi:hypothetical protein
MKPSAPCSREPRRVLKHHWFLRRLQLLSAVARSPRACPQITSGSLNLSALEALAAQQQPAAWDGGPGARSGGDPLAPAAAEPASKSRARRRRARTPAGAAAAAAERAAEGAAAAGSEEMYKRLLALPGIGGCPAVCHKVDSLSHPSHGAASQLRRRVFLENACLIGRALLQARPASHAPLVSAPGL